MRCFLFLFLPLFSFSQNFELEQTFSGHNAPISYVTFRSEDNLLVSGDENGIIIIWDAQRGQIIKQLTQHQDKITHLTFNNAGDQLASASYDGTIKVWTLPDFTFFKSFQNSATDAYDGMQGHEPSFVTFSPDDKDLYYGGYNLEVLKTAIKNGKTTRIFKHPTTAITCGLIDPSGRHLVIGVAGNALFFNIKTGKLVGKCVNGDRFEDFICEMAFVPTRDLLATWTVDGNLHFWDWQKEQRQFALEATPQEGSSNIAFSGDGQFLVTGNFGAKTKLWDLQNRAVIQLLRQHQSEVVTFDFTLDGEYIVTGSRDHQVNLWKKHSPEIAQSADMPEIMKNRKVKPVQVVKIQNPTVELLFWDNQKIDGDTISVNFNGEWVLEKYQIQQAYKVVPVHFSQTQNYLIIHAHNEGKIPPNTVALTIRDGGQERTITLKSDLKTSAAVRFEYER